MHATGDLFSDKFNNGWEKNVKMTDLLGIFAVYVNNLTNVERALVLIVLSTTSTCSDAWNKLHTF